MPDPCQTKTVPASLTIEALLQSSQPANRMILIGEPQWVKGVIHRLHGLGVVPVSGWTPLLPTGNAGEVISLLKRPRVPHRD
ncbi:MAG TPA: hypothetical protein IGS17_18985 [Oscillatoriales cyanobacterium M59_W2019_021]|nr:hypothetical protein [Oscillatoriales cyanobacterium M4454_W2019_049]HIK52982.1 hypothetical protein [Oscillatoriales cyanobacterium M59_W2019_021]